MSGSTSPTTTTTSGATPEARQAQVTRLYDTVFDRMPDTGGLAFWTGALSSGALTIERVADLLVASSESAAANGNLADAAFVNRMYRNGFGRDPETTGADFWTSALQRNALDRGDVALRISESAEGVASPLTRGVPETTGTGAGASTTAGTGTGDTDTATESDGDGAGASTMAGTDTVTGGTETDTETDSAGTSTDAGTTTGATTAGAGAEDVEATATGTGTGAGTGSGTASGDGVGSTSTTTDAATSGSMGGGSSAGTGAGNGSGSGTVTVGVEDGQATSVETAAAPGSAPDTFSFVEIFRLPDGDLRTVTVVGERIPVGSEVVVIRPATDADDPDAVLYFDDQPVAVEQAPPQSDLSLL